MGNTPPPGTMRNVLLNKMTDLKVEKECRWPGLPVCLSGGGNGLRMAVMTSSALWGTQGDRNFNSPCKGLSEEPLRRTVLLPLRSLNKHIRTMATHEGHHNDFLKKLKKNPLASCSQGQPPCNAFCSCLIIFTKYMDNGIKVFLFYSALNMVVLAHCADGTLSAELFVSIRALGRQRGARATGELRF